MNKILVLLFLVSCYSGFAQSDSTVYSYIESTKVNDPLAILNLRMYDVVSKKSRLPKSIRNYKKLQSLSLRPVASRFAKPRGGGPCIVGYAKSSIETLPEWIIEFRYLKDLDLIGITLQDLSGEMKKLSHLNLTKLSIDPTEVDDALIESLIQLTGLNQLHIRASMTEDQMSLLESNLMDCTIVTGIYADY